MRENSQIERGGQSSFNLPDECIEAIDDANKLATFEWQAASVKTREPAKYILHRKKITINGTCYDLEITYGPEKERAEIKVLEFMVNAGDRVVSTIDFYSAVDRSNTFMSRHRLTDPKERNQGVGTSVLKIAEVFFQKLANQRSEPIRLLMSIAQVRLMRWAIRNGYTPENDAELIANIIADFESGLPSKTFDFADKDTHYRGEPDVRESYVFNKGLERQDQFSAIRRYFTKTIVPQ